MISINSESSEKVKRLMVEEEIVQILTRLGFTLSQAKVYLALFELKEATGKITAKHSKMARQEVYRVLAELQEKDLVKKIIARPTQFEPIPIEDCISILIKRKKNEISETQKEATILLQKFKQKSSKNTLEEDQTRFSLLPYQASIRKKKEMLKTVRRSFDVVTSWRNPHSTMFIGMEDIVKIVGRDVKVRVIIDKPDEEKFLSEIREDLEKYPTFKIRHLLKAPKALMSIYDKKEARVCTHPHPWLKKCPTLWTNNPCLLSIFQDYFETLWLTAIESNFNILSKSEK
jgi:sugar-specific transcriptional regulator TrmB